MVEIFVLILLAQDVRIIDGDTVEIDAEIIRLENIDTPERGGRAECDAERMLAETATRQLTQILAIGEVTIERSGEDRYGRTLARVFVDGLDAGELLVERGVAVRWEGRRHDWCGDHQ
ncbi:MULTISPECIES: thermonuclease family protein [Hyphobacterium]|uniref:Thermonuclease family protein n=1 Tax=Hyphobacterium vulgare TaxID=1736751 RepID=A0ABV6ZU98_9PROT